MKGCEIRKSFLEYFQSKDHTIVPGSSLVPLDDPTLLFTNAGMNQFKACFLGAEKRSYTRATTAQRCMRISGKHNDFENVGVTARHHTFFEMMGNFSFGDYFKTNAIEFAWEFVTERLGLSPSRLWVTIYEGDEEARRLWTQAGMRPERILIDKENFWMMGDTGPCGPCSEIYYFLGPDETRQSEEDFRRDDGSYLEIWNLVFMQYNRSADGKLEPLPKPSVDTGMGLERVASVMQKVAGNYESDLVRPVISRCEELSGFRYEDGSYIPGDLKTDSTYARNVAMRVIADHSRSAAFLLADGVIPSSDGRGYVLRRLLRRAIRHGRVLHFRDPFLKETTARVVEIFQETYPHLQEAKETIRNIVDAEERKFYETLDTGLSLLTKEVEKLGPGDLFPGQTAFLLYDTYGFPIDLTEDALKAYKRKVDVVGYETAMDAQRRRSREERKGKDLQFSTMKIDGKETKFLGYNDLEAEAKILHAFPDKENGTDISLVFEVTPFYAESGGQVGDQGYVEVGSARFQVLDTQKLQGKYIIHECRLVEGKISPNLIGKDATLRVDTRRRKRIAANHSATHIVHAALRKVLGPHVKQAGSRVDDSTLRFDYSHFAPVEPAQIEEIVAYVNEYIRVNHEVTTRLMNVDDAKRAGAMALFGEKYGAEVRVVQIGPDSLELCGGTHVTRSGDIGLLLVGNETGVAAGVRRIECYAGEGAHTQLQHILHTLQRASSELKCDIAGVPERIEKIQGRIRLLERELEAIKGQMASSSSEVLLSSIRRSPGGISVVVEKIEPTEADTLKNMVDTLRNKLGSGVVALASNLGEAAIIVAGVTPDLASKVNVGKLLKEAAALGGGRGGGRSDFAQAGGVDPSKLSLVLERLFTSIS